MKWISHLNANCICGSINGKKYYMYTLLMYRTRKQFKLFMSSLITFNLRTGLGFLHEKNNFQIEILQQKMFFKRLAERFIYSTFQNYYASGFFVKSLYIVNELIWSTVLWLEFLLIFFYYYFFFVGI